MSQPLAPNLGQSHLHAAFIADHSAMLHSFVLAAEKFPVCHRSENLGAEKSITLGLKSSIVDGFRLGDFPVRPGPNLLGRRQTDLDAVKISNHIGSVIWILSKQDKHPWRKKSSIKLKLHLCSHCPRA